jgi:hypothetical protein
MFRVQFGGGIGLGADIKIPGFCHTGLDAGQYMNIGLRYDEPELSHDASATLVAWHWEGRESRRPEEGKKLIAEHQCWGWIPPVTTVNDKDGLSVWDFEIGIMFFVLDLRLGFNPLRLDHPDKKPRHPQPEGKIIYGLDKPPAPTRRPPATSQPSPYERDPLLPQGDPPQERGE